MKYFAAFSLVMAVLCGCTAAAGLFEPDAAGQTQAGQIATEAAQSTGNPLLIGAVGLVNAILAAVLARKASKGAADAVAAKDKEEYTADDVQSMVTALRSAGWKVDKA